jgi:probable rRNA maturation factor
MPSAIHFFYEDVKFRLKSVKKTKPWIKAVAKAENKKLGELNYIFCSDAFLLQINLHYLQHNTLTDIITFNTSEDVELVEGDIYISVERVAENATKFKVEFDQELHRVIVHGVLHLLGFSDKNSRQKLIMRKKEDAYLSLRTF